MVSGGSSILDNSSNGQLKHPAHGSENAGKLGMHSRLQRRLPTSLVAQCQNTADNFNPFHAVSGADATFHNRRYLDKDQSDTGHNIRTLLKAKVTRKPIALIVGRYYRWWPLRMRDVGRFERETHGGRKNEGRGKYAVLGWYIIRDAWAELEPGKPETKQGETNRSPATSLFVRWKFAFEWIEEQGTPWWIEDLEVSLKHFQSTPCGFQNVLETEIRLADRKTLHSDNGISIGLFC